AGESNRKPPENSAWHCWFARTSKQVRQWKAALLKLILSRDVSCGLKMREAQWKVKWGVANRETAKETRNQQINTTISKTQKVGPSAVLREAFVWKPCLPISSLLWDSALRQIRHDTFRQGESGKLCGLVLRLCGTI